VIVITEKDAVKLAAWRDDLPTAVVLRDALRWDRGEKETRARLLAAVAERAAA
jgi:hypothetical protein